MANGWSLVIGLIVIIAFSTAAWFLSPKGDNQTLFRSTLILTFVSCYLMWAIVFLAQWHPHRTKAVRHSTRSFNWLFARLSVVPIVSPYPVTG
ncbi:hypothetical protein HAV15_004243 [Penicillium sp. str. |nr:hypothetical protein HAV15_004243 [Penicillium sp. str. \